MEEIDLRTTLVGRGGDPLLWWSSEAVFLGKFG